jgi:hypothetical protein
MGPVCEDYSEYGRRCIEGLGASRSRSNVAMLLVAGPLTLIAQRELGRMEGRPAHN